MPFAAFVSAFRAVWGFWHSGAFGIARRWLGDSVLGHTAAADRLCSQLMSMLRAECFCLGAAIRARTARDGSSERTRKYMIRDRASSVAELIMSFEAEGCVWNFFSHYLHTLERMLE